jgi:hypothetical protein
MEPVGLALGIVSVGALFTTFFDAYDKVRTLKHMSDDLTEHQAQLALESERVRFVKDTYNLEENFPAGGEPLLMQTMKTLNEQIGSIRDFMAQHFVPDHSESGGGRTKLKRRFSWAASNKRDLEQRLGLLHNSVDVLWWLVAASDGDMARNNFLLRARAMAMAGIDNERGVALGGLAPQFPGIVKAARVKQLLRESLGRTQSPPSSVSSYQFP